MNRGAHTGRTLIGSVLRSIQSTAFSRVLLTLSIGSVCPRYPGIAARVQPTSFTEGLLRLPFQLLRVGIELGVRAVLGELEALFLIHRKVGIAVRLDGHVHGGSWGLLVLTRR